MKFFRLLLVSLVAVFAFGALMASSAFALPEILPESITSFTGKNVGETNLHVVRSSTNVSCRSATAEGSLENRHLGLFHIDFKTCSARLGETSLGTCTGLSEESGVILSLGSWHLVWDSLSSGAGLKVAILFLVDNVHFSCRPVIGSEKLFVVSLGGMVLCLVLNPEALTKVFEFHCNENREGRPEDTKYYNEGGTLVNISPLMTTENENGRPEESIQRGLGTVEYRGTETVLLMF